MAGGKGEVNLQTGPADDTDSKAFQLLHTFESCLEEAGPNVCKERFREFKVVLAKDDRSSSTAIQNIIYQPWFQRVWIQQEFLVARDVHFMCSKYVCR